MSPSPIEEQPVEALDAIALEIDNARDLLNLALTCKSLHALVYFRHLRFRVISGRLGDWRLVDVWDLIARDKTLGRSVRVLDLHPLAYTDPRFIIPLDANRVRRRSVKSSKKEQRTRGKRSPYETIADVIQHFVPALANMTRLLSLSWREDGPSDMFTINGTFDPLSMLPNLWEGVNGCSSLDRLAIHSGPSLNNTFFQMIRMEHVTEFSWKANGSIEVASFEEFLCRGLPNLKKLEIETRNHPFHIVPMWPRALESCHWPHLRSVKLVSRSGGSFGPVEKFFVRHPHIEELSYYLDTNGYSASTQPFLPNLRVLRTKLSILQVLLLPRISSTVLDTIEIDVRWWGQGLITHLASVLKGHPFQSIVHLILEPLVTIGDYDALVAELPGLKSINGVPFEGDVTLMMSQLRTIAPIEASDSDEEGMFIEGT